MAYYRLIVIIAVMIVYAIADYRRRFAPKPKCVKITDFKTFEEQNAPVLWLDIRPEEDYKSRNFPFFVNIPFTDLRHGIRSYSKEHTIVVLCKSGTTAEDAVIFLTKKGYKAIHICGGIEGIFQNK